MLVHEFAGHQHVLPGADDPLRHEVLFLVGGVLPVELDEAVRADLLRRCPGGFHAHPVAFGDLFRRELVDTLLLKAQHELQLFLVQKVVEEPDLRIPFRMDLRVEVVDVDVIGDHADQLQDELFLLFVFDLVIGRQIVVVAPKIVFECFRGG